jgi:hypothetical protein
MVKRSSIATLNGLTVHSSRNSPTDPKNFLIWGRVQGKSHPDHTPVIVTLSDLP